MVLVKKWPLIQSISFSNIGEENVFYDILEREKGLSRLKKTRSSKSRKIDIFPKGLTDGFGLKMGILKLFFFEEI